MKRINYSIVFLCFTLIISGCSRSYRSNAYHQQAQQQHGVALNQNHQQLQKTARTKTQNQHTRKVSFKKNLLSKHQTQPAVRHKHIVKSKDRFTPKPEIKKSNISFNQQHVRNLISRMAHSTIGAPYKWGGNNPHQGFDCSGLMSYVHQKALGINIPRTAAQQRDKSRTVSYQNLQPGDMLFFKTGRNSNHVGIYIGNRKFVHAATGSKHVKVASMDSAYWHSRFVKFGTFL